MFERLRKLQTIIEKLGGLDSIMDLLSLSKEKEALRKWCLTVVTLAENLCLQNELEADDKLLKAIRANLECDETYNLWYDLAFPACPDDKCVSKGEV